MIETLDILKPIIVGFLFGTLNGLMILVILTMVYNKPVREWNLQQKIVGLILIIIDCAILIDLIWKGHCKC